MDACTFDGFGDENIHASEKYFISGVRPPVPINELQNVRGGRRKAGSGVTEQGTDQQGRSGSRRGNEQVMNKFKLATRYKVES